MTHCPTSRDTHPQEQKRDTLTGTPPVMPSQEAKTHTKGGRIHIRPNAHSLTAARRPVRGLESRAQGLG